MKYFGVLLILFSWMYTFCSGSKKMERSADVENEIKTNSIVSWTFHDLKNQAQITNDKNEQALVDSFMNIKSNKGFPLIEDSLCHFIYQSDHISSFLVAGDFNGWNPQTDSSSQLQGTNLHYISKKFPLDARLDYKMILGSEWILDPLNPKIIWGGFGPNSEIAMPEYQQPWEIELNDSIPQCTFLEHLFESEILGNERNVKVYLPPGYDKAADHYPSLYVNDGGEYLQLGSMVNILNNLQCASLIASLIVIFVDPVERMKEYALNEKYLEMLEKELIPFIDSNYRTIQKSEGRGMIGVSLGGLTSLYAGLQLSDLIGKVAGQSSAIQWDNQKILQLYQEYPLRDLQIYLDWGTYEGLDSLSHRFVQLLQEKGYSVNYKIYNEGHSWGNWRAHIDEILKTFWEYKRE
jgi:enterochelin esterase family protein